ncbi:MAG: DUF3365 domain-containing protein [Cyanophyceae cyanobacterium]
MFQKFNLSTKFNILLWTALVGGILLTSTAFAGVLIPNAQAQVTEKAEILIQAMNSVRNYTSTRVNPQLSERLETEPVFIPETVPSYSAREVFEHIRQNPVYQDFFYKEATLNPTNLRDKADAFETEIVEKFRNDDQVKELSGFRTTPEGELFYIARPLAIGNESCLRCHSTPEAAPPSLLATYGPDGGFGWQLNEIIGSQIISVPASQVFTSAYRSLGLFVAILASVFVIVMALVNRLLQRTVIRPLNRMVAISDEVSKALVKQDMNEFLKVYQSLWGFGATTPKQPDNL